jgi:N-acetylglutamate synthase-like GNAT family acetyltransferase
VFVQIRSIEERDLDDADRIMRVAFGTFLRARDPLKVLGDSDYLRSRFLAEPGCGYVAECDGEVVGSSFATRWGSFGLLGPISVRHDLWGRGIARPLLAPLMDLFDTWQVREAGLSTFPNSSKHIGLYQTYGFWPQQLTAVLGRSVPSTSGTRLEYTTYRTVASADRPAVLSASRALTGALFDGLDLSLEIDKAESQKLGDTVLVRAGAELAGVAVCHCGAGEAWSASDCLIKFAAVRPGPDAAELFEALVDACEQLARERELERVSACVSTARADAYRRLLARGYRAQIHAVDMIRPNAQEFLRPDAYVIHDLR